MSVTLDGFREHVRQVSAPRTALAYSKDAEGFEEFRAGRPLTLALVEAWAAGLDHGRLNAQTVARKTAALKAWLGHLGAHGDDDALRLVQVLRAYRTSRGPRQADRRQVEPVTREEYREARARAPEWGRHLMDLLWWTGCRISEVLGDVQASVPIPPLTVRDGLGLVSRGYARTVGKGGKVRTLVMLSAGRIELARWLDGRDPGGPLFAVTPQAANAMLHRAGLQGGAHRFRHSFTSRLRRAGVREEIIRAMLGHGPRDATDRYGAVTVEEMIEAVERMAAPYLEEEAKS
ncbi:MAG: tyrosine-type recombinase/integrase [Anaerolineales bacterium]